MLFGLFAGTFEFLCLVHAGGASPSSNPGNVDVTFIYDSGAADGRLWL